MQRFVRFEAAVADSIIAYNVSLPPPPSPRGVLIVIHGHSRTTTLVEAFARAAARDELLLLAPIFDTDHYDDFQVLRGRAGPGAAADALNAAYEDAARSFGFAPAPFLLAGISGGAQFAHRYAMCFPGQVAALVAASAGWYTMPDPQVAFPCGCAASDDMPAGIPALDAFVRLPIRVMVGERDTTRDVLLRRSAAIDRVQGRNRLQRARAWVRAIADYAHSRDLYSPVALEILPDCGHSSREAVRKGQIVQRTMSFLAGLQTGKSPAASAEPWD
jgi:pimeloyl-ACP methyl ester carboxylesterase